MSKIPYLRPGDKAPVFDAEAVMPSLEFEHISLDQYSNKWLLLFSYPRDFSYVPPTEIIAFNDKLKEFEQINCGVLGISTDSVYVHCAWRAQDRKNGGLGDIDIPIIGDIAKDVAKKYGFYNSEEGCCISGICVINPKGIVMSVSYDSPDVGRSIDEALNIVKQCQNVSSKSLATFSVQQAATKVEEKIEKNTVEKDESVSQTKCCFLI